LRRPAVPRRAALLGAAGLLSGCTTIENWVLPPRPRLPGERDTVLAADPLLQPDEGLEAEPVVLPPPEPRADWPQMGGGADHMPGHPAAGERLTVAWTASLGSGASARQRLVAQPVISDGTVFGMPPARSRRSMPRPAGAAGASMRGPRKIAMAAWAADWRSRAIGWSP